jgi:hypothetical protein
VKLSLPLVTITAMRNTAAGGGINPAGPNAASFVTVMVAL